MKQKTPTLTAIACALAIASSASFAAEVAGGSSTAYVVAGPSNMMGDGFAGISMPKFNPPTTNPVDQSGIVSFKNGPIAQTNAAYSGGADLNGYYYIRLPGDSNPISETWRTVGPNNTAIYAYRQIGNPQQGFPQFGGEVVAKVSGHEVYFGEWAPKGNNTGYAHNPNLNMNNSRRTVFYVGENPTTSMPTLANAKYDVVGVRRYNPDTQGGVFKGVLTANYGGGSGTLSGSLNAVQPGITNPNNSLNFNGTTISSNGTFSGSTALRQKPWRASTTGRTTVTTAVMHWTWPSAVPNVERRLCGKGGRLSPFSVSFLM